MRHPNFKLLDCAVLINGKKPTYPLPRIHIEGIQQCLQWNRNTNTTDYHIKLKTDYEPVQVPPRSVPVRLKAAYKEEFQWLCNEGIIIPVWKHTEWTKSIVPIRKADGCLRQC